jgi:hypothetical protein
VVADRPERYSYSTAIIRIALLLYSCVSALGCRGVCRILTVLASELGFEKIPHHTTIRQWVLKKGYYQVARRAFEKAKDWCAIFDLTVEVGALKCLLVLGIRLQSFKYRGYFNPSHQDTEVLGIYFTANSTGKFVNDSLKDAEKKIGTPFASLLSDQGSDVTKGASIYQSHSKETIVVHDISHKIAIILERELKSDPKWKMFCDHLSTTKLKVQQTTDLAALMPPKLRSKARYMSADVLMNWVERFQNSKKLGYMDSIPQDRLNEYFGWLDHLTIHIECWKQMIAIGERVKGIISKEGYSHEIYQKLEDVISEQFPNPASKVIDFIDAAMNAVWDEVEQLKRRQFALGDSRVIESVFGKFKQSSSSQYQGITIGALGIATFMASNEPEEVKEAMEGSTVRELMKWSKEHIGNSLASIRRKFFPHKKRNKNSEILREQAYA